MRVMLMFFELGGVARAEPAQKLEFDDDVVVGETPTFDGVLHTVVKHGARERLLHPRTHFLPEIIRSAEDR